MGNTVGSLTKQEKDVITGSILGDGYLRIVPGRKNALFEINSSIKEKDYIDWKFQILRRIILTPPRQRKGKGNRIAYRFSTQQHPDLTKIYRMFYCNQIKIVPDIKLNPLVMAVWFMDDGSKTYKTHYINTQGFDRFNQEKLIGMLKKQYDVDSTLNKDKIYYRVRIRTASAKKFRKIIRLHVISSMKYKLGETP